jgi:uncharacterized membrane protein YbhN (UPF0104 family)
LWLAFLVAFPLVATFSYMYSEFILFYANLVFVAYAVPYKLYNSSIFCSIPGRYESFHKELDYAKQFWKNRQELKVEDAGIALLFGLEVFAWFCAGEIVGRGFTFTGYSV